MDRMASRLYRLPRLDRTGFIGGIGIAEVVAVGVTLSVAMVVVQLFTWPTWLGLVPAGVVYRVSTSRLARPGGLHFAEYWTILAQRVQGWLDSEWTSSDDAALPPALSGVEFVELERVRGVGARVISGDGDRPGAVLDRVDGNLSMVVRLDAPRFLMLSAIEQEAAVKSWANTLATLTGGGESETYLAVETSVANSTPADHWEHVEANHASSDGAHTKSLVARSYRSLVERHGSEARSASVLLTFTLTFKARSRKGEWGTTGEGGDSAVAGLMSRGSHVLGDIHRKLRSQGMGGHTILNVDELRQLLAARVDPFSARGRSALHDRSLGVFVGMSLTTEPPRHVVRAPNYVVINGVFHWTGWVNQWPLEQVPVDWGVRLFGEYAGEMRSISYHRAVPKAAARRRHRSDAARHWADEAIAIEKGKPVSLDTQQAMDEVDERGDDLRAGHQELGEVTLVSVSAPSAELLRGKVDTLLTWASNNGFGVYGLPGAQEAGWAASLPFGLTPMKTASRWD